MQSRSGHVYSVDARRQTGQLETAFGVRGCFFGQTDSIVSDYDGCALDGLARLIEDDAGECIRLGLQAAYSHNEKEQASSGVEGKRRGSSGQEGAPVVRN
jgi:hypothetical protein